MKIKNYQKKCSSFSSNLQARMNFLKIYKPAGNWWGTTFWGPARDILFTVIMLDPWFSQCNMPYLSKWLYMDVFAVYIYNQLSVYTYHFIHVGRSHICATYVDWIYPHRGFSCTQNTYNKNNKTSTYLEHPSCTQRLTTLVYSRSTNRTIFRLSVSNLTFFCYLFICSLKLWIIIPLKETL